MRIITVVMGEPDSKVRNSEVTEMLDYAFAQYELERLLSTESVLGKQKVEKGSQEFATLVPTENVSMLNKKIDGKKNVTYNLHVNKLKAPVKKGDIVGKIDIVDGENIINSINITVNEDILKSNFGELLYRNSVDIIRGFFN